MPSILLVDDDKDFRVMLHAMLRRAGYQVREAQNGNEALALHRERPSDVIILDLLMPEKEGIETILELRRTHANVKIIAISGSSQVNRASNLEMARRLGAEASLEKPFSREELLDTMARVLSSGGNDSPGFIES
jgi:CheY-like chemotaxis protein